MSGIRTFNTNLPHTFRFPEWTQGIAYPVNSMVAVEKVDGTVNPVSVYYDYYLALVNVQDAVTNPSNNPTEWYKFYSPKDPDINALLALLDSDMIETLIHFDSDLIDIRQEIDSDRHQMQAQDSELGFRIDSESHIRLSADSDLNVRVDSEIHDRKAVDSDILVVLNRHIQETDSDLNTLFLRTDSDEGRLQYLLTELSRRADSDIMEKLRDDSDLRLYADLILHDLRARDSEHDSDILQNTTEIDEIRARLDSDFSAAMRSESEPGGDFDWGPQPFVSNTDYYIDEGYITNHNEGYLWLIDHQNQQAYILKDGVRVGRAVSATLLTTEIDPGLTGLYKRGTQITDGGGGADVNIYQNTGAALPIASNANLFTVVAKENSPFALETPVTTIEEALQVTANTVVQIDSDLYNLTLAVSSSDSEIYLRLESEYRARKAFDSDLGIRLDSEYRARKSTDSDIFDRLDSEYHDRKAADSDLRRFFIYLESDIRLSLDHDSEINVALDSEERARYDGDSDIYNKYHSVHYRYVKSAHTPTNFTVGAPYWIDYIGTTSNITSKTNIGAAWIWNPFNDVLMVTDSDGSILYSAVHEGEPIVVSDGQTEYVRRADTLVDIEIRSNGVLQLVDDIWEVEINKISNEKIAGYSKIRSFIDSDLNLHEKDSDERQTAIWVGDKFYQIDSDMDMEVHDRKAADSDLQTQIWDNDSDIAYIRQHGVFYRGSVDFSAAAPAHTAINPGDLYYSTTEADAHIGWDGIAGNRIYPGQFAILTDDSDWKIFGPKPEEPDSDHIAKVDQARLYKKRHNRERFKLHYAENSQTLFFEGDSEEMFVIDTPTYSNDWPHLIEGTNTTGNQVSFLFTNFSHLGLATDGTRWYLRHDKVDGTISKITGVTGATLTSAVDQNGSAAISPNDSEDQEVTITFNNTHERGDTIVLYALDGRSSRLANIDGTHYRHVPKWEIAMDSEYRARKDGDSDILASIESDIRKLYEQDSDHLILHNDLDSDLNNGHLSHAKLEAAVLYEGTVGNSGNTWRKDDGVTPDISLGTGGRGSAGFWGTHNVDDIGWYDGTTNQPITVAYTVYETNGLRRAQLTILFEGKIVYREFRGAADREVLLEQSQFIGSDNYLYEVGASSTGVGTSSYYEVRRLDPQDTRLVFTKDSEYTSSRQRDHIISESIEALSSKVQNLDQKEQLTIDSEIHDRKAADSDIMHDNDSDHHTLFAQDSDHLILHYDLDSDLNHGHLPWVDIEFTTLFGPGAIPPTIITGAWERIDSDGTTYNIGQGGAGARGYTSGRAEVGDGIHVDSLGQRVSHAFTYDGGTFEPKSQLVIVWDGVVQYVNWVMSPNYDEQFKQKVYLGGDNYLYTVEDRFHNSGVYNWFNIKRLDPNDTRLIYHNDSEYTTTQERDEMIRRAMNAITGKVQNLDAYIMLRVDSEQHDRKAADSDIMADNDSDHHTLFAQDSDHLILHMDLDSDVNHGHLPSLALKSTLIYSGSTGRADNSWEKRDSDGTVTNLSTGGRGAAGIKNPDLEIDDATWYTDQGNKVEVGIVYSVAANNTSRLLIISEGRIVHIEDTTYDRRQDLVERDSFLGSDNYVYKLTQNWWAGGDYLYYNIEKSDPQNTRLVYTRDSEYTTLAERNKILKDNFEAIASKVQNLDEKEQLTIDSEIHARKAADSDIKADNDSDHHTLFAQDSDHLILHYNLDSDVNHGHLPSLAIQTRTLYSGSTGRADNSWEKIDSDGTVTNLSTGGRGSAGIKNANLEIDDGIWYTDQDNKVNVAVVYAVQAANTARLLIISEGRIVFIEDTSWDRRQDLVERDTFIGSDNYIYNIWNNWWAGGDYLYYNITRRDPKSTQLEYTKDSEYTTLAERNKILKDNFEAIASKVQNLDELLVVEFDSERHDWKAGDSDLRALLEDNRYVRYVGDSELEIKGIFFADKDDSDHARLSWNNTYRSLVLEQQSGESLRLGQQVVSNARGGESIPAGTVVFHSNGDDGRPVIKKANTQRTNYDVTAVWGITTEDSVNGQFTNVVTKGIINLGVDLGTCTEGDDVWLRPQSPGLLTNVQPSIDSDSVYIGRVVAGGSGVNTSIEVDIRHEKRLQDIRNVTIDGFEKSWDYIGYDSDSHTWINRNLYEDINNMKVESVRVLHTEGDLSGTYPAQNRTGGIVLQDDWTKAAVGSNAVGWLNIEPNGTNITGHYASYSAQEPGFSLTWVGLPDGRQFVFPGRVFSFTSRGVDYSKGTTTGSNMTIDEIDSKYSQANVANVFSIDYVTHKHQVSLETTEKPRHEVDSDMKDAIIKLAHFANQIDSEVHDLIIELDSEYSNRAFISIDSEKSPPVGKPNHLWLNKTDNVIYWWDDVVDVWVSSQPAFDYVIRQATDSDRQDRKDADSDLKFYFDSEYLYHPTPTTEVRFDSIPEVTKTIDVKFGGHLELKGADFTVDQANSNWVGWVTLVAANSGLAYDKTYISLSEFEDTYEFDAGLGMSDLTVDGVTYSRGPQPAPLVSVTVSNDDVLIGVTNSPWNTIAAPWTITTDKVIKEEQHILVATDHIKTPREFDSDVNASINTLVHYTNEIDSEFHVLKERLDSELELSGRIVFSPSRNVPSGGNKTIWVDTDENIINWWDEDNIDWVSTRPSLDMLSNVDDSEHLLKHQNVLMYDSDTKIWAPTLINVDYGEF